VCKGVKQKTTDNLLSDAMVIYMLKTQCTVQSMVQDFNENTLTLIVLYDALIINCVACIVAELQINAFFFIEWSLSTELDCTNTIMMISECITPSLLCVKPIAQFLCAGNGLCL
jgi:hypothetical protein